ncbi:MAG TPA: hypothetical protein GXZ28_05855 [Clostridiales bacterium]|nr:hypothetical protein [Clostridiales bacterium]
MKKYYLYIVLTRTNTTISRVIQLVKKDEYTHASISLDKELNHMYSFGRRKTYNPFIGRFRKETFNEGAFKLCNTIPGVIIEVQVTRKQYEQARALVNHFILNSHLYKYNYMGLLHSILNKGAYKDHRFLCSEFVYHILKESGVVDFHKARNLVRPQNLLDIKGRVIYEGDLKAICWSKNGTAYA